MSTTEISLAPLAVDGGIRSSITRWTLALVSICIPVALVLILASQIPDKSMRAYWPPLLATLLGVAGYVLYVRKIEKREPTEIGGPDVSRELGAGLALGTVLFLTTIGVLAACGSFDIIGTGHWVSLTKSFTEMLFVASIEEILFRGVVFRLSERSLGSWRALIVSSLVFAVAHLPNEGINGLAIANTALAGGMFGAAYLATRRLWLAIGVHFAWNFVSDGVFALPTSGHAATGLLHGQLSGPVWLSGGAYGIEASVVTLVVLTVATWLFLRHAMHAGHILPRPNGQKAAP